MSHKSVYALVIIISAGLLLSAEGGAVTVPDNIRRPQRGEAARYPLDIIIGELGRGQASEGAYSFARNILSALLKENKAAELDESIFSRTVDGIKAAAPQKFRLGGGREEADGNASFLFRFIGREQWIVGEIYVRYDNVVSETANPEAADGAVPEGETQEPAQERTPGWKVDDIILDAPKTIGAGGETYRYDFSPYERFF
jgi:hypothetical protein